MPTNFDLIQSTVQLYTKAEVDAKVDDLFTQTSNQNVSNTTVETTIIGAGVGSLILPINFFTIGKSIRLRQKGFFSRTNGNIKFRFKLGATTIISTATASSGAGANDEYEVEVDLTCRTIGVAGTVIAQGRYTNLNNGTILKMVSTTTTVINTTITQTVNLTIQFSTANVGNTFTSTNTRLTQ